MHCVYLGVVKQLILCWGNISTNYHWSINEKSIIDTHLLQIKPPNRVSRNPRSPALSKLYKAHKWSMWFFYYSIIILKNILPDDLFEHWLHLVCGVALISKPFTEDHLNIASGELNTFSRNMEAHYGPNNCTYNTHLLLHLSYFASRFGPLYTHCMILKTVIIF